MGNFDIYFSGKIQQGASAEAVRAAIGRLFQLQGKALERLFSGKPVRIKKGVDADKAGRYRAAFREAGALVDIVPEGDTPPLADDPARAQAGVAGNSRPPLQMLPPRTGSLEDCAPQLEAQQLPDVSWMALDLPGVIIDETPPDPAVDIDTSGLSMSEAKGFTLEDCANPSPAQAIPDISHLTLAGEKDTPENG